MSRTRTTTVRDLRRSNRSRALWELYLNGPLTRQEVGTAAGVSPATVSNLVGDLLDQGVVVEVGLEDSNGGRPRGLLEVNPEYGFVIGVDVGETAFLVELFDLGMRVRASHVSTTELARLDPADAVTHVLEGVEAVIAESGVAPERILGIGVGVPGLVEHGDDAIVHGQSVGWDAVPFGSTLRAKLKFPLQIDNGAKTLGQAEKWFGAARGCDDAVIVLLGIGVGTSIISNGELYRGATSSAGEWGHTKVLVGGRDCRCGASGCLEAYVGAGAVVARYDELKRRRVPVNPNDLEQRVAAIVAVQGSDRSAARVLEETATYLGNGIADLVNLFNPERVVVGGWLGQLLGDSLLPRVREVAAGQALRLPFSQVAILKAELGADAVALGAATLPIANVLSAGAGHAPPATSRGRLLASGRAAG
ncbi:MAG: ROK family transcriptional regulator [Actinomycetota bacterium]|nr:ROK family transcriptional regulator [Actinomycetota bacterium]MDQ2844862.1 ROK family transcriptional regulator [Actinomycetota bacterium]MDQ2959254.1 ROK family transcriptional regulator [Actinomycetota bacterium]